MRQMKRGPFTQFILLLLAAVIGLTGCAVSQQNDTPSVSEEETEPRKLEVEIMDFSNETENVIYLAGGCFWGLEQLMQSVPGVIDAQSGYANGTGEQDAVYETILKGKTGFRDTVRVEFDPQQVSLYA